MGPWCNIFLQADNHVLPQDWEMGGPDKDARFNDVFEAAAIDLCVEHIFPMKGVYSICTDVYTYLFVYMHHV